MKIYNNGIHFCFVVKLNQILQYFYINECTHVQQNTSLVFTIYLQAWSNATSIGSMRFIRVFYACQMIMLLIMIFGIHESL